MSESRFFIKLVQKRLLGLLQQMLQPASGLDDAAFFGSETRNQLHVRFRIDWQRWIGGDRRWLPKMLLRLS